MGACTHEYPTHSQEQIEQMIKDSEGWFRESEPNVGIIGAIGTPKSMISGEIQVIEKTEDMTPTNEMEFTGSYLVKERHKMELEPPLTRKQRRAIERKIKKLNSKNK